MSSNRKPSADGEPLEWPQHKSTICLIRGLARGASPSWLAWHHRVSPSLVYRVRRKYAQQIAQHRVALERKRAARAEKRGSAC